MRRLSDTMDAYYLICPHCGHQHSDAWERCGENEEQTECDKCEKPFLCLARHSVTYHGYFPEPK